MPIDPFEEYRDSPVAPARDAFAITPQDGADLSVAPKAIYVGTGGSVVLRGVDSSGDTVFANVATGTILPVRVRAIRATGTTASDIVGLA